MTNFKYPFTKNTETFPLQNNRQMIEGELAADAQTEGSAEDLAASNRGRIAPLTASDPQSPTEPADVQTPNRY